MKPRVLLVDDEPRVLEGYKRNLHKEFELVGAPGPHEGLEAATAQGPFAVVVSDLQMPDMDGISFLSKIREISPDSARIMLTGQADLDASISAVNEGHVFRFLTKPCPAETLAAALTAGVEQYRLRRAERELLGETLRGVVDLLVEMLGFANSAGHDQADRIRSMVANMSQDTDLAGDWELELAASLSQLGTITLSEDTRRRIADGIELDEDEQDIVDDHPKAAFNLLSKIPRLENVARMVHLQMHPASDFPSDLSADPVSQGALMIGLAAEYDKLLTRGSSHQEALSTLRNMREDAFSAELLHQLARRGGPNVSWARKELDPADVHSGMIIDEDLKASSGMLLLRRGERVTPALLERLRSYAGRIGLDRTTVAVRVPKVDTSA